MKNSAVFVGGILSLCLVTGGRAQWATINVNAVFNWGKQVSQMKEQIDQATRMVHATNTIISYAGDPKSAVKNFSDLSRISTSLANIIGPGETADGLKAASAFFTSVDGAQKATDGLLSSIANLDREMSVFGTKQARHQDLYQALAAAEEVATMTRAHIQKQSETRAEVQKRLQETWTKLNEPDMDEAKRDALLAQIAQLQAQLLLLEGQQAALLADMQVEAEKKRNEEEAKRRGMEERDHAESGVLKSNYTTRQAKVATLRDSAMESTPQTSPDWGTSIKPYWAPPK